ncbi:phage portal protein [Streptomyces sp. NPDC054933]
MAANPRAVARALPPANNGPANGSGGFGGVPSTTGSPGGLSPLVASYDQWTAGRPYGTALPRDPETFLAAAFGPLNPIQPVGIDQPDPDSGRPEPRRYPYQVGWNMPIGEPGSEGLKLAPFNALRTIADSYSVARACINLRIQEIVGLEWDITPTSEAQKAMRGSDAKHRDFAKRRSEALKFFRRPDPEKYATFNSWLSSLLEEVFVVDALSIYLQPTRASGKGLLGSDLAALCLIAGDSVRPLLDVRGGTPQPPDPAFQIYDYGVPRVDLMTALSGEDIADMGDALAAQYRGDQLLYLPYSPRTWTPYGFTPLEQAITPVLAGMNRQQYQLSYFADGSVPGMFISAGSPDATPQQLREMQDAWNAMAGDPAWKHKIIVLPNGSKIDPMRPVPLADQFDEIIMTQVCMAYSVMPMELGISPKVSTTQSVGAANQMAKASEQVNQRKALRPLLKWLKASIFDFILQEVCGQADMEWMWEGLEEGVDEESEVGLLIQEISYGLKSIDEARVQRGEQPWGLPMTSDPLYMTPTGITPIGAIDPNTGNAATNQPQIVPGQLVPNTSQATTTGTQQQTPNGSPSATTQGTASGSETPAHAAADAHNTAARQPRAQAKAAALRELDLVRRRLTKGRSIDGWQTRHLPTEVWDTLIVDLEQGATPEEAISKARQQVRGYAHVERRDTVVDPIQGHIAAQLADIAGQLRSGELAMPTFLDAGTTVMRNGVAAGLKAGARHALADINSRNRATKADGDEDEEGEPLPDEYNNFLDGLADQEADQQTPFLMGLATAILATIGADGDPTTSMDGRFDQYGAAARQAYETGYGTTTLASAEPGTYGIVWHTTSAKPCKACADRDGQTFDERSLPGWPGDGGYGAAGLCMGGPNCRCYLEYVQVSDGVSWSTPVNPLADSGLHQQNMALAQAQAARQQQVAAARQAFVASLPDQSTPGLDTSPRERAQARDAAREQLAAEMSRPGHRVLPQDVPAAMVAERVPPGTAAKHDGHADATHEVYAYLARHYPASVLEWVKDAHWHGPTTIGLADIDMARRPGGARDEHKVDQLVHAIEDGTPPPHPIVLVDTPSNGKLEIADGWHRTLAFKKAGLTSIRAWIGTVDTDTGPWGKEMNEHKLNTETSVASCT